MNELPKCGIYRTSKPVQKVAKNQLVYFHNHGDPGPGLYLPTHWKNNQAQFAPKGMPLQDLNEVHTLKPLMAQGLYRVEREFYCCSQNCVHFHPNQLVQLGYTPQAQPILFFPFWDDAELRFPNKGTRIDAENFQHLRRLLLPTESSKASTVLH